MLESIEKFRDAVKAIAADCDEGWILYYLDEIEQELSCGHVITSTEPEPPRYCEECGAKVWKAVKE